MTETLEQFTERMNHVEKSREYIVGMRHQGNSRAIFEFEGQDCFLESYGYFTEYDKNLPPLQLCLRAIHNPPHDYWINARLIYGKRRANKIAKYYKAYNVNEDPYPKEDGKWFYLTFTTFEAMMKMTYDIHTGKYIELFGEEEKVYESVFVKE